MSDDLKLPQVPEATADDPEDVSWALSTAEAMWARGDHSDGIKWVRRAAEAASEAENDTRALELAKAAADLTNLIARMSRTSIDIEDVVPISEPAPSVAPPVPSRPPPAPKVGAAPPAPKPQPMQASPAATKQGSTPSRPPAPLPSRTSQPPPPGGMSTAARGKPVGTSGKPYAGRPPSPKPADKPVEKKTTRKSRDNLEAEARAAFGGAPLVDAPSSNRVAVTADTAAVEVPVMTDRVKRPNVGGSSANEWDAAATQNLTGDELPMGRLGANTSDGDRMTAVSPAPAPAAFDPRGTLTSSSRGFKGVGISSISNAPPPSGSSPPATIAGAMLPQSLAAQAAAANPNVSLSPGSRGAADQQHDPGIMTSQAVRVVVWRDATGVHVAPAGTVVSAITVDAVLVALEPNADLTAWLSQRTR